MLVKISDLCIACGNCLDSCVIGAIKSGGLKYYIDLDVCIQCQICIDSCPEGAIDKEPI